MLRHACSKKLEARKRHVNTLSLQKHAGAGKELFLLRECEHVQDGASANYLTDATKNTTNATMKLHILLSAKFANPKKALAFQTPNRERVDHFAARHIQYNAGSRAPCKRGFEGSAAVHNFAIKGESGKLEVVGLTEPQKKLLEVKSRKRGSDVNKNDIAIDKPNGNNATLRT
jgi:hypothetical protein